MSTEGSTSWPPSLKSFVNTTFARCTATNRTAVEDELKKVIFDAYSGGTIWTTDWSTVKLLSLDGPLASTSSMGAGGRGSDGMGGVVSSGGRKNKKKKNGIDKLGGGRTFEDVESMERRKRRFEPYPSAKPTSSFNGTTHDDPTFIPDQTIVGICERVEKPYLRLTGPPDPALIRPLEVLKKALAMVLERWKREGEKSYGWVCDQLKSVRQDMMVQRIREPFTVKVYETHARIALEKKDLGEYNQCQSQLKFLYRIGISKGAHPMEFKAYRILYLLHTRNKPELNSEISSLTPEEREDVGIDHALQVQRAIALHNYKRLFELYATNPPRMGGYIMDHFVTRERVYALITMCKSYRTLALDYIRRVLAFESLETLTTFLDERHGLIYSTSNGGGSGDKEGGSLDCKQAYAFLVESASEFKKVDLKGQI